MRRKVRPSAAPSCRIRLSPIVPLYGPRQVLSAYQVANIDVSVAEDTTSVPAKVTICASYTFGFTAPPLLPVGTLDLISRVTLPLG